MDRSILVFFFLFVAGMSFSCKKIPAPQNPGDAQWIKVISDSAVSFTGKIRTDAQNNLYCSYEYREGSLSSSSAIIKLDWKGNILWRQSFSGMHIYDFQLNEQDQNLIVALASDSVVTLTKVSMQKGDSNFLGSYDLPNTGKSVMGMKIMIIEDGYLLSGAMSLKRNPVLNGGFILKMDIDGVGLWKQDYIFKALGTVGSTSITGCIQLPDGFLLLGNVQYSEPYTTSEFFVMKCDESGGMDRSHFYSTSSFDTSYHGYYCETSDIVAVDSENFYGCAFNVLYNTPAAIGVPIYTNDDNSARIFKISADCVADTLNCVRVKFEVQNQVADLVKKKDGGLFIGFNPNPLSNFALIGQRNSFIANISSGNTLENVAYIQTQYSDYLGSVCAMPDGNYAIQAMIQSLGQTNYKLQVIKTDENGNF